jgi:hypothetical protein
MPPLGLEARASDLDLVWRDPGEVVLVLVFVFVLLGEAFGSEVRTRTISLCLSSSYETTLSALTGS